VPRRVRPRLPSEWHVPNDPRKWISWKHANEKLASEKVYWISTASGEGKPHAAPVWGIWRNGNFYFETDPKSPKGRNLVENPRIVFHVQDGMDTVIVEGTVEREKDSRRLRLLKTEYVRKYAYKPDWSDDQHQIVFSVKPKIAHAWRAPRMHRSLVNFIF
jgi:nitroimidazol reductase NimA-like FMN-containing flavoprotein (pyridoxamine 5'-phosphate oxidase superfamily)